MLILSLLVAAGWYIKNNHPNLLENITNARSEKLNFSDSPLPSDFTDKLTKVNLNSSKFDILENCSLIKHRNNDGDSFRIKHGSKETEFRLYFVDTAESQYKTYRDGNNNGKRIREQGEYFGGLEMQVTTEIGKIAKSFVIDLLSKQNFTVVTKWENVYTPERKYGYIIVKWENHQTYLHELLIAKGLARIKTRGADLPDNTKYHDQKKKLVKIEQQAKKAQLGAWGM